ncbi:hypothetical protein EU534_01890 [Candidatus Heimdallarchaeota archaeon]|nr:MAG: hypothetical protein EU534_01890 [Candidatus Heimdallarchaeota archaeon]
MSDSNHKSEKKWKRWLPSFNSIDDYFVLFGIILNAFSLAISFAYGHVIAGVILSLCELALIGAYIVKLF